jgi:hypothetical protein
MVVAKPSINCFQRTGSMAAMALVRITKDRRDDRSREALLGRIRAEFEEMPCMRLTARQVRRLFGLRSDVCERLLGTLVRERSLCRCSGDQYRLNDRNPWLGSRAARSRSTYAAPKAS